MLHEPTGTQSHVSLNELSLKLMNKRNDNKVNHRRIATGQRSQAEQVEQTRRELNTHDEWILIDVNKFI